MANPSGSMMVSILSEKGSELLRKLRKPLSFVGERTGEYVYLGGVWVNIDKVIIDRTSTDDLIHEKPPVEALRKRLSEIEELLGSQKQDPESEMDLFREGMAIKKALYIITRKTDSNDSPVADARRWLEYGKRIR
ncbi:MAG: hypothetical protein ACMUIG_04480 [Thermoplasmatota archaeon]